MRNWILFAGVTLVLSIIIYNAGSLEEQYRYNTEAVARAEMVQVVTATGTILPRITVEVGSQLSGQIKDLKADFNDQVVKGQVIARLDPREFEILVKERKAELETTNANHQLRKLEIERSEARLSGAVAQKSVLAANLAVSMAEAQLSEKTRDRKRALLMRNVGSRKDMEDAESELLVATSKYNAATAEMKVQQATILEYRAEIRMAHMRVEIAKSEVAEAKTRLAAAELSLARTEVRAPLNGIIIRRDVSIGQTVAASLQAPTLFSIAQDLARIRLETNVDEADIGRIKIGQHAIFSVEAFPGEAFQGQVERIRKSPQRQQNVITYIVEIGAENPHRKLLPGSTAIVRIAIAEASGALAVPNAALRFSPKGSAYESDRKNAGESVWALGAGGRPTRIAVKTGITDNHQTEVREGSLKEGQHVIVSEEELGKTWSILGFRLEK